MQLKYKPFDLILDYSRKNPPNTHQWVSGEGIKGYGNPGRLGGGGEEFEPKKVFFGDHFLTECICKLKLLDEQYVTHEHSLNLQKLKFFTYIFLSRVT